MSNRAKANAMNPRMTMEQHTAMMILARYRHRLHCNESITAGTIKDLNIITKVIPRMMQTVGLPGFFVSKASMDEKEAVGTQNGRRIIEEINGKIEEYMELIDRIYGTSYRPNGFLRRVYAEQKNVVIQIPA